MCSERQTVHFHSLMPLIVQKLEQNGTVSLPAMGRSMHPLFRHGRDQVTLVGVWERNLRKYDMILYRRPNGQYTLHRIVGVREDGYVLRGDGQLCNEYQVSRDWVIARVDGFHRENRSYSCAHWGYRGYVMVWMNTVWVRRGFSMAKRGLGKLRNRLTRRSGK